MQRLNTPFHPIPGGTVSISATTTSQSVAIPAACLTATSVRIRATGANDVRWRSGVGSGTAATSGDPAMGTGTVESFGINASDTHMAAKCDSGTATIEFTFGFGA